MSVQMNATDLMQFMQEAFPQRADDFGVDHVAENEIIMRLFNAERHLRPGGTVSGPSMFALADVAAYLVTLAMIGPKALAVTTSCSIDFMRKPAAAGERTAHGRLLKRGKPHSVAAVMV